MKHAHRILALFFVIFALIVTYYDPQKHVVYELFGRLRSGGFPRMHSLGLIALWLASLYTYWLLLIYNYKYRKIVEAWVICMLIVNASYFDITKNTFNEFYYGISLSEIAHGYGLIKNHGWHLFMTVVDDVSIMFMVISGLRYLLRRWKMQLHLQARHALLAIAVVIVGFVQVFKYKTNFSAVPSAISVPATMTYHHMYSLYEGPRDHVQASASQTSDADVIILIVDESVRADLMSANGYAFATTPFLQQLPQKVNFGIAASSANCSKYSNIILRNVVPRKNLPDKKQLSLHEPSLFQYAQNAGFHTVYITNHLQPNQRLDNGMNAHDFDAIDTFVNVTKAPKCDYSGDCGITEDLVPIVQSHQKVFVYMNKEGVHYPYENSCPRHVDLKTDDNLSHIMKNYLCGIRWSSDTFMKELLHRLDALSKTYLIFYTSDHGEDVENVQSRNGHGSFLGGNWKQAAVPMIIISNVKSILSHYRSIRANVMNQTSHFDIAPSLLVHMGYNHNWVVEHFDSPLRIGKSSDQRFYSGNIYQMGHWNAFKPEPHVLAQALAASQE